ncbi:MAG: AAA family ATPase, partial [Acidimicrobiia bacterium]|nr:AAA family ATPase [Acidimicrobiia bacterium]
MTPAQPTTDTLAVLVAEYAPAPGLAALLGEQHRDALRTLVEEVATTSGGAIASADPVRIVATFGAASSAVAAAGRLARIDSDEWYRLPVDAHLRVGVDAGEVDVADDGSVTGEPIGRAGALADAAGPGGVIVSDLARMLAGSRIPGAWGDPRPVADPTGGETIDAREMLPGHSDDARPFPPAPWLSRPLPFTARHVERHTLNAAWLAARSGQAPVVVVEGAWGSGSTRLVAELAGTAHADGARVLWGRAAPGPFGSAHSPFTDIIEQFVGGVAPEALHDRMGTDPGALALLAPTVADRLGGQTPTGTPAEQRKRLAESLAGWLTGAAAAEPLLVVIDDLADADPDTIDLLVDTVARLDAARVLVVCVDRSGEALQALASTGRTVEHVVLGELGDADHASLLHHVDVEGDASAARSEVAAAIRDRLGPSPLAVRLGLSALVADGTISTTDGGSLQLSRRVDADALPADLGAAVRSLIDRLDDRQRRVVEAVALLGGERPPTGLDAFGIDDADVPDLLADATTAGVLAADRSAGFLPIHPLVADMVLDDAADLAALGSALATAVESDAPAAAAAIRLRSGASDSAADHLTIGDRYLEAAAHRSALAAYRRALAAAESSDDGGQRAVAARRAAEVAALLDEPDAVTLQRTAALAAVDAEMHEGLAVSALACTGAWPDLRTAVDPDDVRLLDAALRSSDGTPAERALLHARGALVLRYATSDDDLRRREQRAEDAVTRARGVGDPQLLAQCLLARAEACATITALDRRRQWVTELASALDDTTDPPAGPTDRARLAHLRVAVALESGDLAAAVEAAGELRSSTSDSRVATLADFTEATLALARGDLSRAEALLDDLPEAESFPGAAATAASVRAAIDNLREGTPPADTTSDPAADGWTRLRWTAELGRLDDVEPHYRPVADAGFAIPDTPLAGAALANLASIAALTEDTDHAGTLLGRVEPLAELHPLAAVLLPSFGHTAGLLVATTGDLARADGLLTDAADRQDAAGFPLLAAATRLDLARVVYALGDFDRSVDLASAVRDAAETAEATALADQARSVADAAQEARANAVAADSAAAATDATTGGAPDEEQVPAGPVPDDASVVSDAAAVQPPPPTPVGTTPWPGSDLDGPTPPPPGPPAWLTDAAPSAGVAPPPPPGGTPPPPPTSEPSPPPPPPPGGSPLSDEPAVEQAPAAANEQGPPTGGDASQPPPAWAEQAPPPPPPPGATPPPPPPGGATAPPPPPGGATTPPPPPGATPPPPPPPGATTPPPPPPGAT